MTQTADLLAAALEALQGATDAGDQVFSALTWPTWDGDYPLIYIPPAHEDKESLGRGTPQYNVVATFRFEGRMQVPAQPDGASAALLQVKLARLGQQIQVALINNPALMGQLQRFPFIRTEIVQSAAGNVETGQINVEIGMEFWQGADDFYLLPSDQITTVATTLDLVNVFDPSGTYTDSDFADQATPAPRTSGPDGRVEAGLITTLSTED